MTCERAPKRQVRSVVYCLIALFAVLVILVVPPQLTGGGQFSATHPIVPISHDTTPSLFLPAMTYDPGTIGPSSVAVADLNDDGKPDLVVTSCEPIGFDICRNNGDVADGLVSVFLGTGGGIFAPPVLYDSGGENASSVAVADVNRDGK